MAGISPVSSLGEEVLVGLVAGLILGVVSAPLVFAIRNPHKRARLDCEAAIGR